MTVGETTLRDWANRLESDARAVDGFIKGLGQDPCRALTDSFRIMAAEMRLFADHKTEECNDD